MIFTVQETIAFLSQGTTLEQGTVIMTGTPPGIGCMRDPKVVLGHLDDMRVEIEGIGRSLRSLLSILASRKTDGYLGTLINNVIYE
jgi:2-keto-4-pentenoate hydratase/2-oxohepta-3-ene-1,7-dioic acid hydratase in catechol pathway